MRTSLRASLLAMAMLGPAILGLALGVVRTRAQPVDIDQGPGWTSAARAAFYNVDQGSRMMPFAWLKALRQRDNKPFLEGALARYGYLPVDAGSELPVGFNVVNTPNGPVVGMTCAACHTRDLVVGNRTYRIDGGPAFADFGAFMGDLDAAFARTLADEAAFTAFARDVLGAKALPDAAATLRAELTAWQARDHVWIQNSFPRRRPWGPGRLDAITMIFNRLAGLDIGKAPDHMIADNIREGIAPTRYPFLWNSPRQDSSQWAGFTENGNDELAIARNLGEVYGVFAIFHPRPLPPPAPGSARDYLSENSANIHGLGLAEGTIKRLGPPVWPWPLDKPLAKRGEAIFARPVTEGGCAECHAAVPGQPRPPETDTLRTRILDVETDTAQWQVIQRTVKTGTLEGAALSPDAPPVRPVDSALSLLRLVVIGTLQQVKAATERAGHPEKIDAIKGVMRMRTALPSEGTPRPIINAYEARALSGIWAAAPYLHNGTVPTLADLLLTPSERPKAFKIGPAYDIAKVGLAGTQTKFDVILRTTGCDDRSSGDSVCGHEYGTKLTPDEKRALVEYLKTL